MDHTRISFLLQVPESRSSTPGGFGVSLSGASSASIQYNRRNLRLVKPEVIFVTVNTRPLRADAQRNRDKLLAAATKAFAEEGEDVALETVAARADVGIGT